MRHSVISDPTNILNIMKITTRQDTLRTSLKKTSSKTTQPSFSELIIIATKMEIVALKLSTNGEEEG